MKILKIKDWIVKFEVNDRIYFIKTVTDDEDITTLFEYIPTDSLGHYKTRVISSYLGSLNVDELVGKFHTYSQIDMIAFLAKLKNLNWRTNYEL